MANVNGEVPSHDIPTRAFDFAVRIIRLCRFLDRKAGAARTLSSQLLRSGTSIGANVEEGQAAQSKADFIHKYEIALKECRETIFRLRLLPAAGLVSSSKLDRLIDEANELTAMLAKAVITAKANNLKPVGRGARARS